MAEVIRMPRMSDTMEEGNIVSWLKAEGDAVEAGETLAEVETDKATMELDSYFDGVLLHIAIKEGPVPIDGVIAVIGEEGEDWKKALAEAEGAASSSNGKDADQSTPEESKSSAAESPAAPEAAPASGSADDKRIKASPLARSMAKEAGLSIAELSGSGDGGRIVRRDVEAAIEQHKGAPKPPAAPAAPAPAAAPAAPAASPAKEAPQVPAFAFAPGQANYEEKTISQMRKTIARRLSESKFTAPHFYLTIEIDMARAIQVRQRLNEVSPVKISFNDLVVKAAAAALRLHPAVNSSWLGDKIRTNKDVHIGVAVAVEDGLLVPVINYTDMKSLSQINTEVRALADLAKQRKLQPEQMQGNTFTISNLGMFGIEEFTAIINMPDSCILAVGAIIEKPIVKDGQIAVGNMMKVTLSCDHRVVDGATGAQFLQTFKSILEDPLRLLV
jgi:pyruvate dehydrogenase E2 component (dihydrolipoamide acetyltransferase)